MRTTAIALLLLFVAPAFAADEPEVVGGDWLTIGPVDVRGRQPFNPDAVFARHLLKRDSPPPTAGQEIAGTREKSSKWYRVRADAKGQVEGQIAYAYKRLHSARDRVVLADLKGASTLWVNGDAFTGDVYRQGTGPVPVRLLKGDNHLFVRGIRKQFRLTLSDPGRAIVATGRDTTRPDLLAGRAHDGELAVVVANATARWLRVGERVTGGEGSPFAERRAEAGPVIPPLGVVKLPIPFALKEKAPAAGGALTLPVSFVGAGGAMTTDVKLDVRDAASPHRITFRSGIDGSLQEYSVQPATDPEAKGLVLSLHGAGVDAFNQARSYSAKNDMWVVAATNCRPFGFDWQDWGRTDGYEVLAHALGWTGAERRKVYLTGHSMGGHGTWHFAANDPDGFAAIAPSAGWSQFDNYGGRPDAARRDPWLAADAHSATMSLTSNLVQVPAFVLHGAKDDNVPLSEAERMLTALRASGAKPESHFQEGAGHWWNGDAAKGADCVDWPGIFELFRKHTINPVPREVDWLCVAPGVDPEHQWLRIEQPLRYGEMMRIRGTWGREEIALSTHNVRRFRIRLPALARFQTVRLDNREIKLPNLVNEQWFVRDARGWAPAASGPPAGEKTAGLSGPFKRAFGNRFVLVVGTSGSEAESRELLAKARYDAETWWYRGNGYADLVTDVTFARGNYAGRNVILYGNAMSNAAWDTVFGPDCPVSASRGAIGVGEWHWEGENLAAVFVYRRADDPTSLAAAFADSGAEGTRLGHSLLPFVSGVGYPDFAVFGPDVLHEADRGVVTAGWFDHAWQPQPK